jgi:ketosteroid isomerase-like protein
MNPEPIEPATAREPAEALKLVCEALSDGDLEAAVALYEPGATLVLGAEAEPRPTEEVRKALGELMDTRLPVEVWVTGELTTGDLALVLALRTISGSAIDGSFVQLAGEGGAVLRKDPKRGWQVVADDWNLTTGPA